MAVSIDHSHEGRKRRILNKEEPRISCSIHTCGHRATPPPLHQAEHVLLEVLPPRLLSLSASYHKPANLNGRTDPEPACHGCTGKMSAFYTKVGTLLKSRHPIKSLKNWQSISLQPGTTSKNIKSKKCLEFPSALDHQPFWRSVIGPENSW